MVDLATVQADLIAMLKASAFITAIIPAVEVRELQWQGHDFTYPNIRVAIGIELAIGQDDCREDNSALNVSVFAFSEKDSSQECMQLLTAVKKALGHRQIPSTVGYRSGLIRTARTILPIRAAEREWRGQYSCDINVYAQ